jgi:hypothetical protein
MNHQQHSGHESTQDSMPWPHGSIERVGGNEINASAHSLHPEDGGSMVIRNVGTLLCHYTSQPRRPRLESLSSWKSQNSQQETGSKSKSITVKINVFGLYCCGRPDRRAGHSDPTPLRPRGTSTTSSLQRTEKWWRVERKGTYMWGPLDKTAPITVKTLDTHCTPWNMGGVLSFYLQEQP